MISGRGYLRVLAVALALVLPVGVVAPAAVAQPADPLASGKMRLFNIPAQPLKSALEAYGLVTGSQFVYDGRLAEGLRSRPVVGVFSPETALRMLLDGTDLTIRYTGPKEVALVSSARSAAQDEADEAAAELDGAKGALQLDTLYVDVAAGAERHPDYSLYARMIRVQIKKALTHAPETADRIYHIRFELWIDDEGRITKSNIILSSGRRDLDRAIQDVVQGLLLAEPPPKDMPLPVYLTMIAI